MGWGNFLKADVVLVPGSKEGTVACPYWHRPQQKSGPSEKNCRFRLVPTSLRAAGVRLRVKIRRLACPILSASPAPRLSRGANERKARQSAGRINPGRVRRRETGAALMPGLSRRAPPTGHGEYEEEVPPLTKPPGQQTKTKPNQNQTKLKPKPKTRMIWGDAATDETIWSSWTKPSGSLEVKMELIKSWVCLLKARMCLCVK